MQGGGRLLQLFLTGHGEGGAFAARLAALRLAGATTGQVVRLTALDAAGQALIGALIGIAGY